MNRNTGIKCIHCGQLIFRKISKCNVTTCQILRLNCTKFDFRWGYAPDPLAVLKADYFYRDGGGKGGKWNGREGREKWDGEGEGKGFLDQCQTASYAPGPAISVTLLLHELWNLMDC